MRQHRSRRVALDLRGLTGRDDIWLAAGPVACAEEAPFGYVNSITDHVNIERNAAALSDLVGAAYADIRARLDAGRAAQES